MQGGIRIVVPTRGASTSLGALERDLARELSSRSDLRVDVHVVSGGSAAQNRNRGAADATEEWLQFLDDDVRLPVGWLSALHVQLTSPDAPDLLGAAIGSIRPRNWFSQAAEDFVVRNKEYPEGWYLVSAHLTVRRRAFQRLGGFDEAFGSAGGEDWDLCRRAHALGLTVGVTDSVTCRHANPTTWTALAARARAYGEASVTLDSSAGSGEGDAAPPTGNVESARGGAAVRATRWVALEYRALRRLRRSRMRAARSTALQVPWMATYLQARRRIASTARERR